MRRSFGLACTVASLVFAFAGLPGCADDEVVEPQERAPAAPEVQKKEENVPPITFGQPPALPLCALNGAKFDDFPTIPSGADTCSSYDVSKPGRDDAFYLARQARSHILQSSSFIGAYLTLVTDVVYQWVIGSALKVVGLGSNPTDVGGTYDAATGWFTIVAKSGLVIGNRSIGEWDATSYGGEMKVRLLHAEGTGSVRAGQPLEANPFDSASYLRNPKISISFPSGDVKVSYSSTGPLVEMLGYGATPPNPITIHQSDADRVATNVQAIQIEGAASVRMGQPDCAFTSLDFASPKRTIGEYRLKGAELNLTKGMTERKFPGAQKLTFTEWSTRYIASADQPQGTIRFGVDGLFFPYSGDFTLDGKALPSIRVACP